MVGVEPLKLTFLTGSKMSSMVSSLFCALKDCATSTRKTVASRSALIESYSLLCSWGHPLDQRCQYRKYDCCQQRDSGEHTERSCQHCRIVSFEEPRRQARDIAANRDRKKPHAHHQSQHSRWGKFADGAEPNRT